MTSSTHADHAAVLISGGLDSAILLGEFLRTSREVYPLYVRSGHLWESTELAILRRFLDAIPGPSLKPLQVLEVPVGDLLPTHWSINGQGVPDGDAPDEAVYLPGRNVLMLSKALLWCHLHGVDLLALGILRGNPFPDATPEFFHAFTAAVNRALGASIQLQWPYANLAKTDVLLRGRGLPLELTLSCLQPRDGLHCGNCNKCTERRRAFADAGVPDITEYAHRHPGLI